jgi:hypothetical protein
MKKTLWIMLLLVFACSVSFTTVWATEKKAEAKKEAADVDPKMKAEMKKKADLFMKVVAYGEAEKDPIVMLSAVKMLDEMPFKGIKDKKSKDGVQHDRDSLLKKAKEFAADDKEMLAMIQKIQDAPEKTEVRGHHDRYGHGDRYYGRHHYYERRHHRRHYDDFWFLY